MFTDKDFHIIPSVKDLRKLDKALRLKEETLLLSQVHIGNLRQIVDKCHQHGKKVLVNHEIVGGLAADRAGVKLLHKMFQVDGVMGSQSAKLALMKKEGIPIIRRISLIDSLAVSQTMKSLGDVRCDYIELRPAYYAIRYLEDFKAICPTRYLAAGFIDTPEMLEAVRKAGFEGAMTSEAALWDYSF